MIRAIQRNKAGLGTRECWETLLFYVLWSRKLLHKGDDIWTRDLKEMRGSVMQMDVWMGNSPGKGKGECKSPEEGTRVVCFRRTKVSHSGGMRQWGSNRRWHQWGSREPADQQKYLDFKSESGKICVHKCKVFGYRSKNLLPYEAVAVYTETMCWNNTRWDRGMGPGLGLQERLLEQPWKVPAKGSCCLCSYQVSEDFGGPLRYHLRISKPPAIPHSLLAIRRFRDYTSKHR